MIKETNRRLEYLGWNRPFVDLISWPEEAERLSEIEYDFRTSVNPFKDVSLYLHQECRVRYQMWLC